MPATTTTETTTATCDLMIHEFDQWTNPVEPSALFYACFTYTRGDIDLGE